jgi:3-methyladenine DNA glycosylase AlkD
MVKRQDRDPTAPNPRRLAQIALERLAALGDPVRAEGAKAYFKKDEAIQLFGVAVPDVRKFARELGTMVKGGWKVDDAIEFADLCVRRPETEIKWVGFFVLARYKRTYPRDLFSTAKGWLAQDLCASWALVDAMAPLILTPLLERYPGLMSALGAWTRSRNLWVRRAALVALVPLARSGRRLDEAYAAVQQLAGDKQDLIHKASGWLLREAGKKDMKRLERFVLRQGPKLPRTTVRYAIERFPKGQRLLLLRATRPASPET